MSALKTVSTTKLANRHQCLKITLLCSIQPQSNLFPQYLLKQLLVKFQENASWLLVIGDLLPATCVFNGID